MNILLLVLTCFGFLLSIPPLSEAASLQQPRETLHLSTEELRDWGEFLWQGQVSTAPTTPATDVAGEESFSAELLRILKLHSEERIRDYLETEAEWSARQEEGLQTVPLESVDPLLNPVVLTEFGPVAGKYQDDLAVFLGIPFAAPPIGERRWKPPAAPEPWTDVRRADLLPPICPQFTMKDWDMVLGQEDCLYLNIWAPRDFQSKKLPVLFWIFGGGYVMGDGYEFGFYDATDLMKHHKGQFIFVSFNYRVGPFGFMALEELRSEDPDKTSGNYGVQDQQLALSWVQKNIARFGGDPNKVTIFGESAGAFSVCWHMGAERSRGLFHRAIMQSGTCDSPDFFTAWDSAVALGEALADNIGCAKNSPNFLDCVRGKSLKDVMFAPILDENFPPRRLSPAMPWGVVIDGSAKGTKKTPLQSMREGNFNRVPFIAGVNKDEGSIFIFAMERVVPGVKLPLTEQSTRQVLEHFFSPPAVDDILALYPVSEFESHDDRIVRILDDYMFTCSTRRAIRAVRNANAPAWMYRFNFVNHWLDRQLFGAYHSAELVYTFRHPFPYIPFLREFKDADYKIADQMNGYWLNFARDGNPNNGVLPDWPEHKNSEVNLIFDLPPGQLQKGLREEFCDFWDTLAGQ